MLGMLFGKQEPPEKVFCRNHEPKVYSRFRHNHSRPEALKEDSKTVPSPQTVQVSVRSKQAAPVIDPIHHLYSNAPIPVDVLRRALPQRFREIDAKALALPKMMAK